MRNDSHIHQDLIQQQTTLYNSSKKNKRFVAPFTDSDCVTFPDGQGGHSSHGGHGVGHTTQF